MKYTFNTETQAIYNDNDTTALEQIVPTNPEAGKALPPGRYYVLDATLWCEPAMVTKTTLKFTRFGKPRAVCSFPMNSAVIIDSTKLSYGNTFKLDSDVY